MRCQPFPRGLNPRHLGLSGSLALMLAGCAAPPHMAAAVDRYRIELALDPPKHHLAARVHMDVVRTDREPIGHRSAAVAFKLHPDLRVRKVRAAGAHVIRHSVVRDQTENAASEHDSTPTTTHRVLLDRAADAFTLTVEYEGVLFQDVAAGERPGEIHNFNMRAHVGSEGIYLADGYWYPELIDNGRSPPHAADFSLTATDPPGMVLAVGAEREATLAADNGYTTWRTPFPLDGLVVVGGPHQVHATRHHDVAVTAHLQPELAEYADGLLEAVRRNLDRYEPLIGPYPAREYKIVENFFSSGFAFPTMTLLSSAVIRMGERALTTHGYLDHEMLHSWWGNGVLVDPRDGNWCESLTSYATNYYGHVLDGNPDEARRKRRNYSHFLSRIKPEQDKPLGTYGRPDGCGRDIAYHKGAMVFHMLARKMGQENFWKAIRSFNRDYLGVHADWSDIRHVCEEACGQDLSGFFDQWVRRGGAPDLRIESAAYDSSEQMLYIALSQSAPAFDVEAPVRIVTASGTEDRSIHIDTERITTSLPVAAPPLTVELDPDYHLFRKIPPEYIIPTTASTRSSGAFTSVVAEGNVPRAYLQLRDIFANSFPNNRRIAKTVGALKEGDLADRNVLILGEAVRSPYVSGFLEAIEFPVTWTEQGFVLSGVAYEDPADAVLCTVRHPGVPGGGVTVLYANSEEAIPRPFVVPMYEHSLVIFQNGHPTVRLDFEEPMIVNVEHR